MGQPSVTIFTYNKMNLNFLTLALALGFDCALGYLQQLKSYRKVILHQTFCKEKKDGYISIPKIREPMITSKYSLFNTYECPVGQVAKAQLAGEETRSSSLPLSEPSELNLSEDGQVVVVDNFRFHISSSDLDKSIQMKSKAVVSSDDSLFSLDSNMIDLLETAEKSERDGKVVYKIEMDYNDLMKSVSKVGSENTLADEISTGNKPISKSYSYDESLMMDADEKVLSELRKSDTVSLSRTTQSRKPPPLALTVAEMSRPEIAENLIGTAFVGAALSVSIIFLTILADVVYKVAHKLFYTCCRSRLLASLRFRM